MKTLLILFGIGVSTPLFSQSPKLYIHIVSHNEPSDNLQNNLQYAISKQAALQMANIVDSKNVKWNMQTSDGFVIGALNDEANTSTNIFELLAASPYSDNIQIDPRSKNMDGRNIADQWYLLDSLGANPTSHLGGCIYSTTDPGNQPIDWEQYRNPIVGNIYGNSWQCTMITGAGSYPPHTNDLNDFGLFKPDSPTNFYQHNPNENLWCMGTGCAPVLDSLDDEQAIIDLIQGQVDSIQNGLWPQNKFYVTRIMTNQREYGPLFFQKISKVIDSLNLIPTSQLEWATISEVYEAFTDWQTASGQDHSQWLCGEEMANINDQLQYDFEFYPNPSSGIFTFVFPDQQVHTIEIIDLTGKVILQSKLQSNQEINIENQPSGLYLLKIDSMVTKKLIKE